MWKMIFCIMLAMVLSGCVSAKYNPETKEISYTRIGDQELGGVEIILTDGSSVTFEKQKSEARIFQDMLSIIKEAYMLGRNSAGVP